MSKILYFSTHEPLEYDDILLFRHIGHTVFSLGIYCPANPPKLTFRPALQWTREELELADQFHRENCFAAFSNTVETQLTRDFLNLFDAVVVIQDLEFIRKYQPLLKDKTIIWRTVGQGITQFDRVAADLRADGMKIVRWSARESRVPGYVGHDAIIRAYKNPLEYGSWNGDQKNVLTFSNQYQQRYAIEYGIFERVVGQMNFAIGGVGNEGLSNSLGLLTQHGMMQHMRGARAYFYCHSLSVPYTLNFIEAWMTGVPVVALRRDVEIRKADVQYNEISDFITHGVDGFLVKSESQARIIIEQLLDSKDLCRRIGSAGRNSAIRLFSLDKIAGDWKRFLGSLGHNPHYPEHASQSA